MLIQRKIWNGLVKEKIRVHLLSRFVKTSKIALMMPANTGFCIEESIHIGLIDPYATFIYVVEYDPVLIAGVEKMLKSLNVLNFKIINRDLCDIDLMDFDSGLPDFAYLDTCSTYSKRLEDWLRFIGCRIFADTRLAFTFSKERVSVDLFQSTPSRGVPKMSINKQRNAHACSIAACIARLLDRKPNQVDWGRVYKEFGKATSMIAFTINDEVAENGTCDFDLGYHDLPSVLPKSRSVSTAGRRHRKAA